MKTIYGKPERVDLIREEICYQYSLDEHSFNSSNLNCYEYIKEIGNCTVYTFKQYFATRRLKKDYTFRHPKNLWHLLLYFCFGNWDWFNFKFIEYTTHIVSVKEAYINISFPKEQPRIYIDKFTNNLSEFDKE